MTSPVKTLPASASAGEVADALNDDGCVVVSELVPPGVMDEVAGELALFAMTEFTDANGATRVIPGSHRWEDRLQPDPAVTVGAAMAKGSVFIYVGSVYHGGGANRTDTRRLGINVGYSVGWLRQEENQYLACPPEVARTLPEDLLKLMGYQRGAYALGYVDDLRDPLDWLHDRSPAAATFSP
jgi:ectoine hydroxylase-related dioxygenase (phytanoyl-CoA dioxygenase family)